MTDVVHLLLVGPRGVAIYWKDGRTSFSTLSLAELLRGTGAGGAPMLSSSPAVTEPRPETDR
jgi:hypothetical protein